MRPSPSVMVGARRSDLARNTAHDRSVVKHQWEYEKARAPEHEDKAGTRGGRLMDVMEKGIL